MIRLYNMDCMDAMREMKDKQYELAIVDPPYGIGVADMQMGCGKSNRTSNLKNRKWSKKGWDENKPNSDYFAELFRVSKNQIIWGGNYFGLPPCRGFIVWDKGEGMYGRSFSECEFAWSSAMTTSRIIKLSPFDKNRIHPTQKPIELYKRMVAIHAKRGDKILDTHLGSGSIAIACHDLGFDLDGYEIDADYFNGAKERLENHMKQPKIEEMLVDWKQGEM